VIHLQAIEFVTVHALQLEKFGYLDIYTGGRRRTSDYVHFVDLFVAINSRMHAEIDLRVHEQVEATVMHFAQQDKRYLSLGQYLAGQEDCRFDFLGIRLVGGRYV
jgi:hypothetical protein